MQILEGHFRVLTSRFDGHVRSRCTKNTLDVHGEPSATKARFKNSIARTEAESSNEKASIFAADGLSAAHHAFAQFGQTGSGSFEFLLSDFNVLTDLDTGQVLLRIEHAKSFDFDLLINQFNDVCFAVFLDQYGPFRRSHDHAQRVGDVKVRI